MKFEYLITGQAQLTGGAAALNEIGADGWRLVAMQAGQIIWERPASSDADAAEEVRSGQ